MLRRIINAPHKIAEFLIPFQNVLDAKLALFWIKIPSAVSQT